jgi:hypothetical protein
MSAHYNTSGSAVASSSAGATRPTPVLHTRRPVARELAGFPGGGDAGDAFDGQLFVCARGEHVWGWRRQRGGGTLLYGVNPVSAATATQFL